MGSVLKHLISFVLVASGLAGPAALGDAPSGAPDQASIDGQVTKLLDTVPFRTFTSKNQATTADSVNVIVFGSEQQLIAAMYAANWRMAADLTWTTGLQEMVDAVSKRDFPSGPVSTQYLFGQPQAMAFEQEENRNARTRHHIRFWAVPGQPGVWVGAATEDVGIIVNPLKGIVTHDVNVKIDAERDFVVKQLTAACGKTQTEVTLPGSSTTIDNHQGQTYSTDGKTTLVNLAGCPSTQIAQRISRLRRQWLESPLAPRAESQETDVATIKRSPLEHGEDAAVVKPDGEAPRPAK